MSTFETSRLDPASATAQVDRARPESWLLAVVDDEPEVCKALRRLLRSVGLNVNTFASGQEFLRSAKEQAPDCLILDLHLPGLSGLDVQKQLSASAARFPVIVITGRDEPGLGEQVLASGAAAFLLKPVNDADLLSSIHSLCLEYYGVAPEFS